jgi:hypothetical protein
MLDWDWEWLRRPALNEAPVPTVELALRLAAAFVFGCVAAVIHRFASVRGARGADRSLMATLVLLSVLIALVTMVIGNSPARAFSLVGALAIIRFRTVVEDTRDTAFVIYAVVVGMAAGTGDWLGPLLCTPLVVVVAWVFRSPPDTPEAPEASLVLRLAAGRPPDERIQPLLMQHLGPHRLKGLSTVRGGSALDAVYSVRLPPPEKAFALVAELNRIEGVQGVEFKA